LIEPQVREKFIRKQIKYVRNYGDSLGLNWQTVFKTTDRKQVEEYCRQNGMEYEWIDGNRLRTSCVRPAYISHPKTGDKSWFNQAQHWHFSCLDRATRQSVSSIFNEKEYPRNCYYGDGTPIEDEVVRDILKIYKALEFEIKWQAGDVLLLDNILTAHGRNPYTGERSLLVALGDMLTYEDSQ
jgi:alpha-ketoglutarate-dependent taurine dioxygenase